MWSEPEHRALADFDRPEILEADLAPLCLELALWGTSPENLRWLDTPPSSQINASSGLLKQLGAMDSAGRITELGRKLAELPVHPRLGMMLVKAGSVGLLPLACEIAALLEERDILEGNAVPCADIRERLRLLRSYAADRSKDSPRNGILRQVLLVRDQLLRIVHARYNVCDIEKAGIVLAFAYPDRIGKKRKSDALNYLLTGGHGATFASVEPVARSEYIVAARLDGAGADARILVAAPLDEVELTDNFSENIKTVESIRFDREKQILVACRERRLGELVLSSGPLKEPPSELVKAALIQGVRESGLHVLPWDAAAVSLRERVIFAARLEPGEWPDWSDEGLMASLEHWLAPFIDGMRSFNALSKLDLKAALRVSLGYQNEKRLEKDFPERLNVPSGSSIKIDYSGLEPELPVRVQEMFGSSSHPSIRNGKLKLRVRLLSPAMRPIQITSDLPSFWKSSWELVRKDMKGRYPKHHWPDDPANSLPTRKAKTGSQ